MQERFAFELAKGVRSGFGKQSRGRCCQLRQSISKPRMNTDVGGERRLHASLDGDAGTSKLTEPCSAAKLRSSFTALRRLNTCYVLARQMKLREAILRDVWKYIADEEDLSWIDDVASRSADEGPMGDFAAIMRRILAAGISKQDIARFAKISGYEAAFGALYILDGGTLGDDEITDDDGKEIGWRVQAFDYATDQPIDAGIRGLHESILSADPTGREMRPPAGT